MSGFSSHGSSRASFLRWAVLLVPGVVLLGILSGFLANSGPGNVWFAALAKPAIYPPPATFGVVWTILYVMIGFALTMVVTSRNARGRRIAMVAFVLQLLLNLAWSPLFFAAHRIFAALVLLGALDVAVLVCVALFARVRPMAGVLLVPYLAWVLFATLLNWQFLVANPAR
jgi:benzodiazapine receptor